MTGVDVDLLLSDKSEKLDESNKPEKRPNVILIGMLGVGKTAVGRMLAERLGMEFVDIEAEMERVTGLKLAEIYKKYGAIRFYAEEELLLRKLEPNSGKIISTGGALIPRAAQMEQWHRLVGDNPSGHNKELILGSDKPARGKIIWLQAGAETVFRRIRRKQNSCFLSKNCKYGAVDAEVVAEIMSEREPVYRAAADFAVDLESVRLDEAVSMISNII